MADTGPARIPCCCCDDRLICRACRISVTWLRYYGAMLRKAPQLEAIEIFVAAAQGDSFRSVASRLALSPSAVSRRIAPLESFLVMPLFARSGQSQRMTTAGQRSFSMGDPANE